MLLLLFSLPSTAFAYYYRPYSTACPSLAAGDRVLPPHRVLLLQRERMRCMMLHGRVLLVRLSIRRLSNSGR